MQKVVIITRTVRKEEEGSYFTLPFTVEPLIERLDLSYSYAKTKRSEMDGTITEEAVNTIDLFLYGPEGSYIGSSGSDRSHIWVCAYGSAQGYASVAVKPGEWAIGVGAYHVAPEGVEVTYTLTFTMKERRLFIGDTHVHTQGSDGFMPLAETAKLAQAMGLDYIAVTDHNNYAHNAQRVEVEGLTVLPGCEWTHYKGHAGLLGVAQPFARGFVANTLQETAVILGEARERGAMVVLDHPFCPLCPWLWGFEDIPYDAIEVWNGVMSERNLCALAWWHGQLCQGRHLPVTGGSDFHRPDLLGDMGTPSTCLYALSREPEDLMAALRAGHSYISYVPKGPGIEVQCGELGLGDTVKQGSELELRFFNLHGGDVLRLITDLGVEEVPCEPDTAERRLTRIFEDAKFCRFEVIRTYAPGLPPMVAMISNPVYFER